MYVEKDEGALCGVHVMSFRAPCLRTRPFVGEFKRRPKKQRGFASIWNDVSKAINRSVEGRARAHERENKKGVLLIRGSVPCTMIRTQEKRDDRHRPACSHARTRGTFIMHHVKSQLAC